MQHKKQNNYVLYLSRYLTITLLWSFHVLKTFFNIKKVSTSTHVLRFWLLSFALLCTWDPSTCCWPVSSRLKRTKPSWFSCWGRRRCGTFSLWRHGSLVGRTGRICGWSGPRECTSASRRLGPVHECPLNRGCRRKLLFRFGSDQAAFLSCFCGERTGPQGSCDQGTVWRIVSKFAEETWTLSW